MKTIGSKSALMAAIDNLNYENQREDEFSVMDFVRESNNAGKSMTIDSARAYLRRLHENGNLSCRKIIHKGKITNFYSAK